MLLSETDFAGAQPPIDGYAPGGFRVQGRFLSGPILLSPVGLVAWPPASTEDGSSIDAARIEALLALAGSIDIALIGMGPEMRLLDATLEEWLFDAGIGAAPMATPSACRSYNVALSEDRRVAAALVPI